MPAFSPCPTCGGGLSSHDRGGLSVHYSCGYSLLPSGKTKTCKLPSGSRIEMRQLRESNNAMRGFISASNLRDDYAAWFEYTRPDIARSGT